MEHEEFVELQRIRLEGIAAGVLLRQESAIEAARQAARIIHSVLEFGKDPDLQVFVLIESETDALPKAAERHLWSDAILKERTSEIAAAEAWAFELAVPACRSVLEKKAQREKCERSS